MAAGRIEYSNTLKARESWARNGIERAVRIELTAAEYTRLEQIIEAELGAPVVSVADLIGAAVRQALDRQGV